MRAPYTQKIASYAIALLVALFTTVVGPAVASAVEIPVFRLEGSGLGHGLGLSQLGAVQAAKQGLTAEQIIKHYYTNVTVEKRTSKAVRVHLDAGKKPRASWTLRPGYAGAKLRINDVLYDDNRYTFKSVSGRLTMTWKVGGATQTLELPQTVSIVSEGGASPALVQVADASGPYSHLNTRHRGAIVLTALSTGVEALNSLSMQQYLYGVVPRELGDVYGPPPAASQAQAIAARSYAWKSVNDGAKLTCTALDQVYGGHSRFITEANRTAGVVDRFEQTNSNAAVDATRDLCVIYGGSVVKAFFSSSNGPRTARNEDVWGSAPLGYLRGVKDPYYPASQNWTKTMTGMEVAAQLANKGYGVTGAGKTVWVSSLTPTHVNSGWVRSVEIGWSNGSVTTIALSDRIRIAFGLRSGFFTVKTSIPEVPPVYTPYEDSSPAFSLVGPWKALTIAGNSGGVVRTTMTKGSYFQMRFKGEGVRWIGPKASSYGRANVYLNGKLVKTVNLYRSTTARQQALYEVKGLDPSLTHTLKVVITTKTSGGYGYIGLDRVDVANGAAIIPPLKAFQESSGLIRRTGSWGTSTSTEFHDGKAFFTKTLNGTITTKFKGSAVRWEGYTTTDGGRAKIYLNGVYQRTVSSKSSTLQRKVLLYQRTALDPTKVYTLKIVNTTAAGSSRAGRMTLDQIQVRNGTLVK